MISYLTCLADFIETEWQKLRSRFSRVNRDLRERKRSGQCTKLMKNAQRNVDEFRYLAWLEEFIKLRQSKKILNSQMAMQNDTLMMQRDTSIMHMPESMLVYEKPAELRLTPGYEEQVGVRKTGVESPSGATSSSFHEDYAPHSTTFTSSDDKIKHMRNEVDVSDMARARHDIVQHDMARHEGAAQAAVVVKDDERVFGELVASRLRRLKESLSAEEIEDVEDEILSVLKNARFKRRRLDASSSREPTAHSFSATSSSGERPTMITVRPQWVGSGGYISMSNGSYKNVTSSQPAVKGQK